jgi:hypothetical protein
MRRSKVERMPAELRAEIERRWREGAFTLDELMAFVRERKADAASDPEHGVSRSGLHRYLKGFEANFEKMRRANEIAGYWANKFGAEPRVTRMLQQLLATLAMRTLEAEGESPEPTDGKDLFFLTAAIKNLVAAEKTDADREARVRETLRRELAAKLDRAEKSAAPDQDAAFERAREMVRGLL